MLDLPNGSTNPRIVLGYDNQIKIMVDTPDDSPKWTAEDLGKLEECKIKLLEESLGYKITKLSEHISHDKFEENLARLVEEDALK